MHGPFRWAFLDLGFFIPVWRVNTNIHTLDFTRAYASICCTRWKIIFD